jgi:signal transduction histidine kinase
MRADGNQAVIAISDSGLGIPAEALPQLFKRFYRVVRDGSQHISGSGIGLYVVKEIVTGHGGTIEVVSTVGSGSTFTVRLPLSTPDE